MNKLTVVVDKLIYKRYGVTEKCDSEYNAWKQLNALVPQNIPPLVFKKSDLCVFEYLNNENNLIRKKDASNFAGNIMVNIYNKYQPTNYIKGEMWKLKMQCVLNDFSELDTQLTVMGYKDKFRIISNKLEEIKLQEYKNISFLHRDIHRGNILLVNGQPYLIDHEHATEGPIELELQNSLFWNDKMSLSVGVVKNIIQTANIPYSDDLENLLRYFYLADQLILAFQENKLNKVKRLLTLHQ